MIFFDIFCFWVVKTLVYAIFRVFHFVLNFCDISVNFLYCGKFATLTYMCCISMRCIMHAKYKWSWWLSYSVHRSVHVCTLARPSSSVASELRCQSCGRVVRGWCAAPSVKIQGLHSVLLRPWSTCLCRWVQRCGILITMVSPRKF